MHSAQARYAKTLFDTFSAIKQDRWAKYANAIYTLNSSYFDGRKLLGCTEDLFEAYETGEQAIARLSNSAQESQDPHEKACIITICHDLKLLNESKQELLKYASKKERKYVQGTYRKPSLWHQEKDRFSWDILLPSYGNSLYSAKNARGKFEFYYHLVLTTSSLLEKLKANNPADVHEVTKHIRNHKQSVPSVNSMDHTIQLQIGFFTGGNIISDIFGAVFGILAAVTLAALSVLYMVYAYILWKPTGYFGTCRFLFDMCKAVVGYALQLVSSVAFPISMIESKYSTGSINLFKGRAMRALDSIDAAAQEETKSLLAQGID